MSAGRVDTLTALVRMLPCPDGATHYAIVPEHTKRWGGMADQLEVYWLKEAAGRWWASLPDYADGGRDWRDVDRAFFRPEQVMAARRPL